MVLAGVPVADSAVAELAWLVRDAGAVEFVDRLEQAVTVGTKLLALTMDERAIILEDPRTVSRRSAVS